MSTSSGYNPDDEFDSSEDDSDWGSEPNTQTNEVFQNSDEMYTKKNGFLAPPEPIPRARARRMTSTATNGSELIVEIIELRKSHSDDEVLRCLQRRPDWDKIRDGSARVQRMIASGTDSGESSSDDPDWSPNYFPTGIRRVQSMEHTRESAPEPVRRSASELDTPLPPFDENGNPRFLPQPPGAGQSAQNPNLFPPQGAIH